MGRYLFKKAATLILVLIGISLIAFLLGAVSPGDPAEIALSQNGVYTPTAEQICAMRVELELDAPLSQQYFRWLRNVLRGDLGASYITRKPVITELARRLPITLRLAGSSFALACTSGFLLGLISAAFKNKLPDRFIRCLVNIMLSFPVFWLSLLMILVFAEIFHVLPTSGVGGLRYMIMPAAALSSFTAANLTRLVRASLLAEMGKQYYLTAAARGFSLPALLLGTALPNALLPAIAVLGNYLGGILGGSVVIETIFAIPGVGGYAIDAISMRDYPALQGYVLLTGFVFVLVTLLVDMASIIVNPRIRLEGCRL